MKNRKPLFNAGGECRYNACVNFLGGRRSNYDLYAQGYRRAAHILVEYIGNDGRGQDTLIYPIVFLARQYLELKFKYLWAQLHTLLGKEPGHLNGHDLTKLWDECAALIREADLDGADDLIKTVKGYVYRFCVDDPTSQAFRYPVNADGKPSLPGIAYVDIMNFHERTSEIEEQLEALDSYLQAAIDDKREFDAVMADMHGTEGLY